MNPEIVQNSDLALQDHCSYKAPTTNHYIKQTKKRIKRMRPKNAEGACRMHGNSNVLYSANKQKHHKSHPMQ